MPGLIIQYIVILCCTLPVVSFLGPKHTHASEMNHAGTAPSVSTVSTDTAGPEFLLPEEPPVFPQSVDKGCDLAILMETSGDEAAADAVRYRKDALKLLLSLLGDNDRVAIAKFGKEATALSPLAYNTEQNRPALFNELERRASAASPVSAIEAVRTGHAALKRTTRQNRALLLLTSGRTAPDGLNALLPELAAGRIRLHVIADAENPFQELFTALAGGSGGSYQFVQTGRDLHLSLASLYEKLKTPDLLPVTADAFTIDHDITEATVVISKNSGAAPALAGPSGAQESALRHARHAAWYASEAYDLAILRSPLPGQWRIMSGRGARVYVRTELRLGASLDKPIIRAGEKARLDVWLENKGMVIAEPRALGLVSLTASASTPEGKSGRLPLSAASNPAFGACKTGVYSGSLIVDREGVYLVRIAAAGKTFFREKELMLAVAGVAGGGALPDGAAGAGGVSWWSVLGRFALVNCAVGLLIGGAFILRTVKLKITASRASK